MFIGKFYTGLAKGKFQVGQGNSTMGPAAARGAGNCVPVDGFWEEEHWQDVWKGAVEWLF
jgi:hypothetical protein